MEDSVFAPGQEARPPFAVAGVAAKPSDRDALAARMFPDEWARVHALTGERARRQRHNLRRRALVAVQLRDLRERGASCATCRSLTGGVSGIKGPICDAHSDFHGYAITTLDGLCADWTARKASLPAGEPRGDTPDLTEGEG